MRDDDFGVARRPLGVLHSYLLKQQVGILHSAASGEASRALRRAGRQPWLLALAGAMLLFVLWQRTHSGLGVLLGLLATVPVVLLAAGTRRRLAAAAFTYHLKRIVQAQALVPEGRRIGITAYAAHDPAQVTHKVAIVSMAWNAQLMFLVGLSEDGRPRTVMHALGRDLPLAETDDVAVLRARRVRPHA